MRIKKTSQYIEGGASLSNVYGTSNENGYTQEYINGLETYSTTEQRIGTWTDGKPLYRIVYSGNVDIQTGNEFTIGVLNIDKCVSLIGSYNSSDNSAVSPIPSYVSTTNYVRMNLVNRTTGKISVQSGFTSSTTRYIILIVEYTKTTD